MIRRFRRFGVERGLALPMALVVMSVSGALVVSVVQFTTSSGRTANVAKGRSSADSFAEAGIANALAVLNYSGNNPSTRDAARLQRGGHGVHADRLDL